MSILAWQADHDNEPKRHGSGHVDSDKSAKRSIHDGGQSREYPHSQQCVSRGYWEQYHKLLELIQHLPLPYGGSRAVKSSLQIASLEEQRYGSVTPVSGEEKSWFGYDTLVPLPYNHLRLVRVLPSLGTIECSLATYPRRDPEAIHNFWKPKRVSPFWDNDLSFLVKPELRYTCLSYQWGPKEPLHQMKVVRVNGKQFRVRSNLYDFLEKARACKRHGPFWIDAISINQEDVEERNEQVKVMGQIFNSASSVLVWLGKIAMQNLIQELGNLRSRARPYGHRRSYKKYFSASDLFAVMHTIGLDYWNRTWVVQEMIIGDNRHFWLDLDSKGEGNASPSLQSFYKKPIPHGRFLQAYEHLVRVSGKHNSAMSMLLKSRLANSPTNGSFHVRQLSEPIPLLRLLQLFKHTRCSDPRDRVYGILSMALEREAIAVDYNGSTCDLLCRVIWACRGTFCLCLVHHLLDALELRHDRNWELSPPNVRQLIEQSGCRMSDMEYDCISIRYKRISIKSSGFNLYVHGRGLPTPAAFGSTLQETFRRYPQAKALKTCRCRNALSESWRNKQGLSICLMWLCAAAEAFRGTHIFFEERGSKLQATGVLSRHDDEYSSYDFSGISLVYEHDHMTHLTVKLSVIGLLQLMSLLPANGTAIHPSKVGRLASYEVLPPVETQVIREPKDEPRKHGWNGVILQIVFLQGLKHSIKPIPPKHFPRALPPRRNCA